MTLQIVIFTYEADTPGNPQLKLPRGHAKGDSLSREIMTEAEFKAMNPVAQLTELARALGYELTAPAHPVKREPEPPPAPPLDFPDNYGGGDFDPFA